MTRPLLLLGTLSLMGCGILDDLGDTAHAQAARFEGDGQKQVCRTIITINMDPGTYDTTRVCEVPK